MRDSNSIPQNESNDEIGADIKESDTANKKRIEPRGRNVRFTATHGPDISGKGKAGACTRNVICTAPRTPEAAHSHNKAPARIYSADVLLRGDIKGASVPEAVDFSKDQASPQFPDVLDASEIIALCDTSDPHCVEASERPNDKKTKPQHYNTNCRKEHKKHEDKMPPEEGLYGRGLLFYEKWWYRSKVDIIVNGKLVTGFPIFVDKNTIRVVNEKFSYFIPIEKIDYIRTSDGLV